MADESQHDASWYLCKENVQPLAKGRDVSKIEESASKTNCLDIERASYEEKILLDDGDDPLQNWLEFIDWIEQSYPCGGKEGRLMDVLTDCVQRFIEDSRYGDDERFYSVFARYRRRLSEPLEKYDSLFAKKVFTKLASFYIDWSWLFETAGNFKEADNVLDRGLLIGAEPQDEITTARVQLQTRLAKKIVCGEMETTTEEPQRKALIGLKPRIKKDVAIAPVDRVSSIKIGSQGLASSSTKSSNSIPLIYVDEENMTPDQIMPTGSVKSSIVTDTKENSMKPGKWSDFRIKKKPIAVPRSEFVIYEEEDEDKTVTGDSPLNATISADVFKVKKRNDDSPPLVKPENLANQKFYCDLDRMYIGGTEYSFEEIRYKKFIKAKKMKEDHRNRQEHMEALLQRIAALEEKIAEREEKEKEKEQKDKTSEEAEKKRIADAEKEREQQERYREIKEKERSLKDKEREIKDHERENKDHERESKDQERIRIDAELQEKEERRVQNELERLANESERLKQEKERQEGETERINVEKERIMQEKERIMQEKEREINEKERGIKIKEMDQAIQGLESKLSTLIKLFQEKKPENCEVSAIVRNLLNGSYDESRFDNTLTMPITKPPVPVKDFTIYKDEPTENAPLIRFDISEPPRGGESTLKADADTTTLKQKLEKMDPKSDFEHIHRGSMHYRLSEAFTMMVPHSEDECLPKSCSTPGK
ncbi:mitotic checkpoint serine/threonine-protein kinase BUB1 beta-like [Panonychus citri]|uniref:mitotic checkpoint serine/threonine-protein kinase BUB1 beta-like n=1 Tax=Panonychus citri TaxID=50023 RepID=UPI002307DC35|nr:mitotic checkpoint serine/threonine-protein kinase BUB1 beta-like [Panonychus citri]